MFQLYYEHKKESVGKNELIRTIILTHLRLSSVNMLMSIHPHIGLV